MEKTKGNILLSGILNKINTIIQKAPNKEDIESDLMAIYLDKRISSASIGYTAHMDIINIQNNLTI